MFNKHLWSRISRKRNLIMVLSFGLLLRVALSLYVLSHYGSAWFFARGSEMGFLAESVLQGNGLSSPFGALTGPTAIVAPGYPLLVAAVFRLLGSYTSSAALCLMLFQACCNTVTVYLIYRLGRALASERASEFMAMFWACSVPLLWMPTIFWDTSISSMMTLATISLMQSVRQMRTMRFWFACGSLCGLVGLLNPALLPSSLVLSAYTLYRTSPIAARRFHALSCLIGFALVFAPWPTRNARVFHACVLTRSTVGLELWMGNHPGANGFLEPSLFPTNNPTELAEYRRFGEMRYTTRKGQLARNFIFAQPMLFARMSASRCFRFWSGSGTRGGSVLFRFHATISSLLGACGFLLLWRGGNRRACTCAAIFLLLFPLPYYITHAEFRYRLVLDPLLSTLGAPAIQWFSAFLQSSRRHTSSKMHKSLAPAS